MADYRKMTLQRLRDLAKKTLGPGHSKRPKSELIGLLEKGDEKGSKPAREVAPPAKAPQPQKLAQAASETGIRPERASKVPVARTSEAGRAKKPRIEDVDARTEAAAGAEPEDDGAPDAEGYFVARVRGEDAAREAPHPLTETAADLPPERRGDEPLPPVPDEGLGELPWSYGDDAFVALPRDPRTLFLYWDFSARTTEVAFAGLVGPHCELRLFVREGEGWSCARTVGFALESRGFYVHDLIPGRLYRAEIHAVDRHGQDRAIGSPSNEMMLPPLGPSPIIDDRFIRLPWDVSLGRLLGPGHVGGPFSDEARMLLARLSDWSRFGGGGGSLGGIGGRGPGERPGSESGAGRGV